ncbi:MAG TPA: metallophosphoesterase family protein, partial [Gemmataceae bacterium]|nr:metallophosphoesterase family protein [Gemmataceae bacterium]
YIRPKSATRLSYTPHDVLLTHDSPRDAVRPDSGSEEISRVIRTAQPAFAFFGHYGGMTWPVAGDFGATQVFHLGDLRLQRDGGCAEEGSVGALTWEGGKGKFTFLDARWLRGFTRHNWQTR